MKIDKDKLTNGNIKQPIGVTILGGGAFFLVLTLGNTIIPYPSGSYFCASSLVGILFFYSHIWIRLKPTLYARFFLSLSISAMFLLMAWRSFSYLFPQIAYLGIAGTTLLAIFAHTLPMWNRHLADVIRSELYAPKTRLFKMINRVALSILVLGPALAGIFSRNKNNGIFVVFLVGSLIMAVIMPFAQRAPGSPWERDLIKND